MTFGNLVLQVERYIRMQGNTSATAIIRDFINQDRMTFARLRDWLHLQIIDEITLDGSEEYDLSSLLSEEFFREVKVFDDSGYEYRKYNYDHYKTLEDKSYSFALFGTTLYISGDSGTIHFQYVTIFDDLSADDDEPDLLVYYWDILKQMAIVSFLDYLPEEESALRERKILELKLAQLRNSESLAVNAGAFKNVSRK